MSSRNRKMRFLSSWNHHVTSVLSFLRHVTWPCWMNVRRLCSTGKNPLRWRRRPFLIWEQFLFRSLQHLSKRHQMTRKKKRERRNRKKRAHELWWCKHHFTHHFPLSLLRANDLIWATATADGYALTKYREIQQIWSERKNHTQAISFFSRLCLHH